VAGAGAGRFIPAVMASARTAAPQQPAMPAIGLLQIGVPPPGTSPDFAGGSRTWAMSRLANKGRDTPRSVTSRSPAFQGFLAGLMLWLAGTAPVVEEDEDGAKLATFE
jgi:hypothetical protein